jgi:hypothetical protein
MILAKIDEKYEAFGHQHDNFGAFMRGEETLSQEALREALEVTEKDGEGNPILHTKIEYQSTCGKTQVIGLYAFEKDNPNPIRLHYPAAIILRAYTGFENDINIEGVQVENANVHSRKLVIKNLEKRYKDFERHRKIDGEHPGDARKRRKRAEAIRFTHLHL